MTLFSEAAALSIRQERAQPVSIKPSLLLDMADEMLASQGQRGGQFLAHRFELGDEVIETCDSCPTTVVAPCFSS